MAGTDNAVYAVVAGAPGFPHPEGNLRVVYGVVTFGSSYPTGGYSATPAAVGGLNVILAFEIDSIDRTGTWAIAWDGTKVHLFSALGTEVTPTNSVATAVAQYRAVGI